MTRQCEMMIGFLIPRQCDQKARSTCIRCSKQICDEHAVVGPEGILCEACHEGVEQLAAATTTPDWVATLPDYHADDFALFDHDDVDTGGMFDDMS
jgi:hypothetical protein